MTTEALSYAGDPSSVVAATITGALDRAIIPEKNIGRSSDTLNTATPVRAMSDALCGEKSVTSAWTDR